MGVRILIGDVRDRLKTLPDESVHCVVTSPPYWGLRDYGAAGQLGLEATYPEYVANMAAVFREVRRVLRPDGTLWLNLGDSYATGAGKVGDHPGGGPQGSAWAGRPAPGANAHAGRGVPRRADGSAGERLNMGPQVQPNRMPQPNLKPKDLVGIPWRVAFALQDDGWWLRQEIIWHKPNPMPESVTDRCTKSHEHLFLMAKSERYYFDAEAIAEDVAPSQVGRVRADAVGGTSHEERGQHSKGGVYTTRSGNKERKPASARGVPVDTDGKSAGAGAVAGSIPWEGSKRNKRSVWTVTTRPFSEAHFATFPPKLIIDCIKAGCPKGGTVLDPFGGAGTTGLVADGLGRDAILIELNPAYAEISRKRLDGDNPLFAVVAAE